MQNITNSTTSDNGTVTEIPAGKVAGLLFFYYFLEIACLLFFNAKYGKGHNTLLGAYLLGLLTTIVSVPILYALPELVGMNPILKLFVAAASFPVGAAVGFCLEYYQLCNRSPKTKDAVHSEAIGVIDTESRKAETQIERDIPVNLGARRTATPWLLLFNSRSGHSSSTTNSLSPSNNSTTSLETDERSNVSAVTVETSRNTSRTLQVI